jgi:glycine cleavage system T protein (aminomethyltransferase)
MTESPRRTPFHHYHVEHGAKMVPFAGFEMPLQFDGIIKEHRAVRDGVGLFDVSHMGEVEIRGPRALELAQRLVTNDVAGLVDGQALYSAMCLPDGGIVDDVLVYRYSAQRFWYVVNAANHDKDLAWIAEHAHDGAEVVDRSDEMGQLALQGRHAQEILADLTDLDLAQVPYYHFAEGLVAGAPAMVSRTGYTGEDGFEIYMAEAHAGPIYEAVVARGADHGLAPIGLGARDTLRLEMKFALYGNDITEQTTPLEAALGWVVKLGADDFIGKDALVQQKAEGVTRRLVAFELTGRGVPRHGYPALIDGAPAGEVTSGVMSPSLGKPIGLAYLPRGHWKPGTTFAVEIRGKAVDAVVIKPPFYQRPY